MIYEAINETVFLCVPKTAKRILDIGCGSGALGRHIKQYISCEIVGVTYAKAEAALASQWLDRVIIEDINNFNSSELGQFDCVICSHILEHLYQPEELLKKLYQNLTYQSLLIVALPNVLHWKQRLEFIRGRFRYTNGGLMDRTHFRFYDWQTAHLLCERSGYKILKSEADGSFPLPVIRKALPLSITKLVDTTSVRQFPGIFGFQFVLSCCLVGK